MTPETNWKNFEIDHVTPISSFDTSNIEELNETFDCKNTQPLLKEVHSRKGTKYNFLEYQLHIIKAYHFIKLNEKDLIKIFFDEIYSSPSKKNIETNKTLIKSIDDTWFSDLLDMDEYGPTKV